MAQVAVHASVFCPANGLRIELDGRVAAIVLSLAANAEKVNAFAFGKISIDCTQSKASINLGESLAPVRWADLNLRESGERL